MARRPRIRRSRTLVFFWSPEGLHALNFVTGVRVHIPLTLLDVLHRLDTWKTPEAVIGIFGRSAQRPARTLLRDLEKLSLVVREGSTQSVREEQLDAKRDQPSWSAWGIEARLFHFATKRVHQRAPERNESRLIRSLLQQRALPALAKSYPDHPQLALDRNDPRLTAHFPQLLLRRRTSRRFSARPIARADVALLLKLTWGFTGSRVWPGLGRVRLKTSPSGGARYPIEVYVVPLRVRGLPRRIHYYHPRRHALVDLGVRATADEVVRFCGHQPWTAGAAALFVMTAVVPRVTWRYRSARAYRVMLLETGHFCQTFCLLATWLNLASFSTAALDDEYIEGRLGIDGVSETVLYAAGIGALPGA